MNIVVIASEAVPFAKTGGLADVMGALPVALERLGNRVDLIIPAYRQVRFAGVPIGPTGWTFGVPLGSREVEAEVFRTHLPGSQVPVYLVDQPGYFDREQLYQTDDARDYPDNAERFLFFSRAAIEVVRRLETRPEVIHLNDWQAALIPVLIQELYADELGSVGTLLTIHNVAYQGLFDPALLGLTGLESRLFNWRELEFHGRLGFLKGGIVFADLVSTVSPTHAQEIQTPEYGQGLDGLLRARGSDLRGILNGIDVDSWSPARESMIAQPYDVICHEAGKAACKAALQRRASLAERLDIPLLAQIGRLDPQKGWDLLADVADDLLKGDVQMVVLGKGLLRFEQRLEHLMDRHPGKLRAFFEFDNVLAHQIEAGADLFLMPSLYEPCGLNQLYSLIHGTVPVVRSTGGLADSVVDAGPRTLADRTATGFVFHEPSPRALRAAIDRALAVWRDRPVWNQLVETGMRTDWSWERSARDYAALYQEVRRRGLTRATSSPPNRMTSLAKAI